jgi:hypothetical protein
MEDFNVLSLEPHFSLDTDTKSTHRNWNLKMVSDKMAR